MVRFIRTFSLIPLNAANIDNFTFLSTDEVKLKIYSFMLENIVLNNSFLKAPLKSTAYWLIAKLWFSNVLSIIVFTKFYGNIHKT